MCGLAGMALIYNANDRYNMLASLGYGIDTRGNNAAGYVSYRYDGDMTFSRKRGSWRSANKEFMDGAANGDMCFMHSRAPGYNDPVTDAHPFPITRNGKVVLIGAHNGNINDAWESAKAHGRKITVDSMELFELIADRDLDSLHNLHGWGIAEWVETDKPREIRLARLSENAELVAAELTNGGFAWASTWHILSSALQFSNLKVKKQIDVSEIGRVYLVSDKGIHPTDETGIRMAGYGHF